MQKINCPKCGREATTDVACVGCGQVAVNGTVAVPPPEAAGWVIERPSPEMLEEARRTFDEAGFLAGVREIEAGGGHRLENFIDEIERITNGGK